MLDYGSAGDRAASVILAQKIGGNMEKTLLERAEEARQAGNQKLCLKLRAQAEKERYDELQKKHRARVDAFKKEFPVGKYIPELHNTIKPIKLL